MRLLLSAFACDPVTGSEPYVGWNWATRLSAHYDTTVLTRTYSARLIEESQHLVDFNILHFDLPGCSKKDHYWNHIKLYYIVWQFCALFYVMFTQLKSRFDVVHHITYNVVDMPGFLSLVPRSQFIWGPVGGGQVPPDSLRSVYGDGWKRQILRSYLKRLTRVNPFILIATKRAKHVFFANRETAKLLQSQCRHSSILLETAIEAPSPTPLPDAGSLNLLWVGNLIDRKALIIAIDVMGELKRRGDLDGVVLTIAGDGPERSICERRVNELGLADSVLFKGRIAFREIDHEYSRCHVFLFTSVQDTSGNVVLEALSKSRPVICLDHQGAAEIVTSEVGVKVPVSSYSEVVNGFATAIRRFADDRAFLERMSSSALSHVREHHSWTSRISEYRSVIERLAIPLSPRTPLLR